MATVFTDNLPQPNSSSPGTDERLARLGVDLSKYPAVYERQTYEPIVSRTNREIHWPILRGFSAQLLKQVPDPVMLTHIVTTRCNYSCGFCSFADTLNAKTNELSLEEIEKTYATIGKNLNVIVYSGGETTLNRNLPEIIEAAYRLTPVKSVYIISNAWKPDLLLQITHRIKQRCPDLHLTWSLSIEGPKPVNNATRYTKANTWDAWQNTVDTLEGLKAIRERFGYRELDVQLCTVCSPGNVDVLDDWYAMVRDELQPDKWNLNLMRRSVQMSDHQLASFDARRASRQLEPFEEKYLQITQQVRNDVLSGRLKFLYHTNNPQDGALKSAVDLISQEENRRTVLEEPLQFCCRAGGFGAYIGSEGEVSGCEEFAHSPEANKSFGNLRDVGYDFQTLWHGHKAEQYRQQVGSAQECRGCTLESQRNYPSILLSFKTLLKARQLARQIH
ncbi:MAG: putative Fe-S oxidoreductase [Vampirovibrio sp.]|jgi:MoaA/NifB/PqqE/SkfB family radical SAM enzyme|nr:putative Fe-S oxidoreductase [Vampirovibrio sp.]